MFTGIACDFFSISLSIEEDVRECSRETEVRMTELIEGQRCSCRLEPFLNTVGDVDVDCASSLFKELNSAQRRVRDSSVSIAAGIIGGNCCIRKHWVVVFMCLQVLLFL